MDRRSFLAGLAGTLATPAGGREIRDVRLLPNSDETIAFRIDPGGTIRLWPRGYNAEQPV